MFARARQKAKLIKAARRAAACCLAVLTLLAATGSPAQARRPVQLFAHRGFTLHQPENSLGALTAAIDLGLDGSEVDLRTTRDGRIVLLHDAGLERTSNCRGLVRDMTWEQVRGCRLRDRQGRLTGQRVPLLEQALDLVKERPGFGLALDTKQADPAKVVRAVVSRGLAGRVRFFVPRTDRVRTVQRLRALHPGLKVCVDLSWWWKIEGLPGFVARALKAGSLFSMEWNASAAGFAEARRAGAGVTMYLWGDKNLPARALRAARMGATLISCDRPDQLLPLFRSKPARPAGRQ